MQGQNTPEDGSIIISFSKSDNGYSQHDLVKMKGRKLGSDVCTAAGTF